METKGHKLAVGSFAIALVLGVLVFILWLSRFEFGDDNQTYMIHFKGSVTGLRANESVRFHGIPIGLVKQISVNPKDIGTINVKVIIEKPYLIREDSVASIEAQGLTGFTYVQITGGSPDQAVLKKKEGHKYPIIDSKQSKIEALFTSVPQILDKVNDVSNRVALVLSDENLSALNTSLKNIADFSTILSHGSSTMNKALTQIVNDDIKPIIGQTKDTLIALNGSIHSFKSFMDHTQAPLSNFATQGLQDIQLLAKELRVTNQKMQKIFNQLEASPVQFLKKNQTKGVPVS